MSLQNIFVDGIRRRSALPGSRLRLRVFLPLAEFRSHGTETCQYLSLRSAKLVPNMT